MVIYCLFIPSVCLCAQELERFLFIIVLSGGTQQLALRNGISSNGQCCQRDFRCLFCAFEVAFRIHGRLTFT
jgi:hypothetical protein